MTPQAAARRKSVLAEEFLDVGGDPLAETRGAYTNLILPKSQGHDVVKELSKGVTGERPSSFGRRPGSMKLRSARSSVIPECTTHGWRKTAANFCAVRRLTDFIVWLKLSNIRSSSITVMK